MDQNHITVIYNNNTYEFPKCFNKEYQPYEGYKIIPPLTIQRIMKYPVPFKVLPDGIEFYEDPIIGAELKIYYKTYKVFNALEHRFLRKSFRVTVFSPNELVTILTFQVVKFILLTSFLDYLKENGGYDFVVDSTDLIPNELFLPSGWYSRSINLSFFIEDFIQLVPYVDEPLPSGSIPAGRDRSAFATIVSGTFFKEID